MYKSGHFSLSFNYKTAPIILEMQMQNNLVNTKDLPDTFDFIKFNAPSVLRTECFNDDNLPFSVEIKKTELGHLFEHLLLDELCRLKSNSGFENADFSGRTFWNWNNNPVGYFKILINVNKEDSIFFNKALARTILLFNRLLDLPRKSIGQKLNP